MGPPLGSADWHQPNDGFGRRFVERATTTAALTRRTAIAMIGNGDGRVNGIMPNQIAQMGAADGRYLRWQPQHLVEITVVQIAPASPR